MRSTTVLSHIGMLYKMERHWRGLSGAERRWQRRCHAVPVLEHLKEYLEREKALVLPKSPEGMAIGYTLSNWRALCRYTEDGDLSIDNNAAERSLRGIAMGSSLCTSFSSA